MMIEEPAFAAAPQLLPLYRALTEHIRQTCGTFSVTVKKTQISFSNRHLFAWVVLPPYSTKSALRIGFGLSYRAESPRLIAVSEPWPGRWTHHMHISSTEDIDGELTEWLQSAYGFAMIK